MADEGLHETLGLLEDMLPELDGDVALFDQHDQLLRGGICVFDSVHFLSSLEEAFLVEGIAMTEAIAGLHRVNCDIYERITVSMIISVWDGICKFYEYTPKQ